MDYYAQRAELLPGEPAELAYLVKFFRALGDQNRLRLLEFLLAGERSVSDCVRQLGLAQSRVSAHLACLADCGYVQLRHRGRFSFYRVADPRVSEVVRLAHALTADNAAALVACMRIDPDGAPE